MKGVWLVIIIVIVFFTYAYFGFGDERKNNNQSDTGEDITTIPTTTVKDSFFSGSN